MTGKELLEILQWLPEHDLDKPINMEGCDCFGDCNTFEVTKTSLDLLR